MRAMNDEQVNFYRALMAPFADDALSIKPGRGGKPLTWLDKRSLANRLDSVCGPHGWSIEYKPTARGFTGRMGILCPIGDGEWSWVFKEDGAGYEEMDAVDDDEKSGYTNAFRRVAQDAWGIGRYLYRKGIADFLDPKARPSTFVNSEFAPDLPPQSSAPSPQQSRPPAPPQQPPPAARTAAPPANGKPAGNFDNFKIPKAGKSVFAWVKGMEEHFKTTLVEGLKGEGRNRGYGEFMNTWTQDQVDECCTGTIEHLRTLDNYNGEYGYPGAAPGCPPLPPRDAPPAAAARPAAPAASQAPAADSSRTSTNPAVQPAVAPGNLAKAREDCAAAIKSLIAADMGRPAEVSELKNAVARFSPEVPTGAGHTGEVMASIGGCNDIGWLINLTTHAVQQIANIPAPAPADDIPF